MVIAKWKKLALLYELSGVHGFFNTLSNIWKEKLIITLFLFFIHIPWYAHWLIIFTKCQLTEMTLCDILLFLKQTMPFDFQQANSSKWNFRKAPSALNFFTLKTGDVALLNLFVYMMLTLFNPILSKKPALLFFSFKMKQTLNFRFFWPKSWPNRSERIW